MDVGSIVICITIGALIVFASIGIGVCFGRADKRQLNDDSDVRTYVYMRYRNRGGNNRRDISLDEKIMVLRNIRRLTHGRERDVMDSIEEDLEYVGEMDSRREAASQD